MLLSSINKSTINVNSDNFGGFDMTFATGLAIVGVVAGIILLVTVKDLMSES